MKSTFTLQWKQLFLPLMVFSSIYAASAELLINSFAPVAVFELISELRSFKATGSASVADVGHKRADYSTSKSQLVNESAAVNAPNWKTVATEQSKAAQKTQPASSSYAATLAGFGGPILVVSASSNPFSSYPAEILLAEGLNQFMTADISAISAEMLGSYNVVIIGNIPLTDPQVTMFSNWTNAGGTMIALKPDARLATLLGLVPAGGTLANKYLRVNTAAGPGKGIVNQTMQYQGVADYYSLNGATILATLYSDASTATSYPAVTMHSVGTQGGTAVAFTYDLARSVIYTRQGNPEWSGQKRDGQSGPIRSDDQFYPDWIDLSKVAIPQADEQQRLLANIITLRSRTPVPRFWYLPRGLKAAVVMTGDDHGNGGTKARFNQYLQLSADNSAEAVADWRAIRGTSYIYTNTPISDAEAKAFEQQGFEVALHLSTNCANFTPTSLERDLTEQLAAFKSRYPSVAAPSTNRTHCIAWSDWNTQPQLEAPKGIRLDANYYYWPSPWVQNRPGMFTGSGIPMRFTDLTGSLIDCYQLTTQMTDESDQAFPYTIDQLLNKALGTEGYYGVFCANMHTDADFSDGSDAIIASAKSRNVPVISSKQLLTWLDGRNGSSFGAMSWSGSQLNFSVNVASGARNMEGMLPVTDLTGQLVSLTSNGLPVTIRKELIKGIEYAFFRVTSGDYIATYDQEAEPNQAPIVAITSPSNNATLNAPATITINATASDPDGTVTKVEFFDGDTKLGEDTSSPYSFTWNNVSAGSYTLSAKATDNAGAMTLSEAVGVNVSAVCPCTVFQPTEAPTNSLYSNGEGIQLGMRFRTAVNGFVTGVRFYKQNGNTGIHTGQLYSNTGALLAQAVFVNESASGWQEVNFSSPVAVTAGTTYVISYHSSNGYYSGTNSYFTEDISRHPLTGMANGVAGANGLYVVTNSPTFPTSSFQSSNYWVDVKFNTTAPPANAAPSVAITSPANNTSLTAPAAITVNATASDTDGSIAKVEFYSGETKLGEDLTSPYEFNWNNVTAGSYNIIARAIDNLGVATNSEAVVVNVSAVCPCTVFSPTDAPVNNLFNDSQPIQLGMKFLASINGQVTGVRFYKQSGNTGTHIGQLYSISGNLLAQATFINETASGWQEVAFSNPVAITAGTTYVISYYSSEGHYSASNSYFNQPLNTPPLSALAHGEQGANGVYLYGAGYPTQSSLGANFWVDVVFNNEIENANQPPVVSAAIPDQSATIGTAFTFTFAAGTFTDEDGDPLTYTASLADNAALPAWLGFNVATRTFSGTPPVGSPSSLNLKVTASDGRGGAVSDEFVLSISQPANQPPVVSAAIPDQSATIGTAFTFTFAANTFTDANNDPLTYTATQADNTALPSWLTFTGASSTLSGTPPVGSPSNLNIKVTANDGKGGTVSDDFVLSISQPANQIPVLNAAIPEQSATIGTAFTFAFDANTFTDPDGDQLAYTASLADNALLPAWLTFNGTTRTFNGTPPSNSPASLSIKVVADDGRGGTASDEFVLTISQLVNQAPVLAAIGNKTVNELVALSFTATATDDGLPNNSLQYSLVGAVAEARINAVTGVFSWTPTELQGPGSYTFTIRVSDGLLTDEEIIQVQVNEVNQAPMLATIGNKQVGVGQTLRFTLLGTDADIPAQTMTYSANRLPAGASLNAATGEFFWTPTSRQVGNYKLNLRVSDGATQVSESITITVNTESSPVQPAPAISTFSPTSGSGSIEVLITGSNFNNVSSVTFNGTQATFTQSSASSISAILPASATTGRIAVTTSGGTALSSESFIVTSTVASEPVVNIKSPASGATYAAPASVQIAADASVEGGTISKVEFFHANEKIGDGVYGSNGWSYTWSNLAAGNYTLTALATDNSGAVATSQPVSISVTASSTVAPVVAGFSPASGAVGDAVTISGSNFTGASAVSFNGTRALSYTVLDAATITTNVPAGATTGKVGVTTAGGTAFSTTDFTVTATSTVAPIITSINPTRGAVGERVLVSGTDLANASKLTFGPSTAVFEVDSDGNIWATVPAVNGKLPAGVKVTVTTPAGNYTFSDKFTITASLATTSVKTLQASGLQEEEGLQVYPNPFYDKATISFTLQEGGEYTINLYDAKGAKIAQLGQGILNPGERRSVMVDGTKLSKGLYLVRLQTGSGASTVRLVLDK